MSMDWVWPRPRRTRRAKRSEPADARKTSAFVAEIIGENMSVSTTRPVSKKKAGTRKAQFDREFDL